MKLRNFLGASSVAALLGATASLADVSAQDVWNDWRSNLESYGYEITAEEQQSGDTLTITDFKAVLLLPEGEGMISASFPSLEIRDRGDGTVEVFMAEHNPFIVDITPKDDEPVRLEADFFHKGLTTIVSGTPEEIAYDSKAEEVGLKIDRIEVDGKPVPNFTFNMTGRDFTGNYISRLGNLRVTDQQTAFGVLEYAFAFEDPDNEAKLDASGTIESFNLAGHAEMPLQADFANLTREIRAGFSGNIAISYGSSSGQFMVDERGKVTTSRSSSGEGAVEVAISEDGIMYGARGKDTTVTMSIPDLPFPELTIGVAETAARLKFPVLKSEEPQEYAFMIKIVDLALPEEIWAMADPMGALPHDPATILLDLGGKAILEYDLLDPENEQVLANRAPGTLETVDLNALLLKIVGAELSGNGQIRIDNEDLASYGGTPKPVGEINLMLVGGNALLDKLVQMGLVPEDQAMGFRMMLGMFAQPGDGEDVLVSKIEFTEEGQVLANGQRLK